MSDAEQASQGGPGTCGVSGWRKPQEVPTTGPQLATGSGQDSSQERAALVAARRGHARGCPGHPRTMLEHLTGVVLLAVVIALAWATVTAYQPSWLRLRSLEAEVLLVLGMLTAALLLVSIVALRNTHEK